MHFTLDGESFELTPEAVRARLVGHLPESIREYWVDVDGVRWPVKQVISLATGVTRRNRFQSQDSRRWLQALGFKIGAGAAAGGEPTFTRLVSTPRQTFLVDALEPLDSVQAHVAFTWLKAGSVTLDSGGFPQFPMLPPLPGLYRFDFGLDDEKVRTLYIGESVSLRQRASNYRNARTDRSRQRTSRRIHKEVAAHLTAGGSIEFAIATEVAFDGHSSIDLRLKSARRLAENVAVLLAQLAPRTAVLNIDTDLGESDESVADQ